MDLLQEAAATAKIKLAAAIVVHRKQVLVVQRSQSETFKPGVWGVPCGKIDGIETPAMAAVRELREETGLNGAVITLAGESKFDSVWRGRPADNFQYNFLMRLTREYSADERSAMPEVETPLTDQGWRWVPIGRIAYAGLDSYNRRAVDQALAAYSPVEARFAEYSRMLSAASSSSSWRR